MLTTVNRINNIIGYADFAPVCLNEGESKDLPQFEPFSELNTKAQTWIKSQRDKRMINVQTLQFTIRNKDLSKHRNYKW